MNRIIPFVLLSLLLFCCPILASAQLNDLTSAEKKYYNEHPEKILPDAKTSFTKSEYLQTQKLCRFHSFVLVDEQVQERKKLWADAEKCAALTEEMLALKGEGKITEAKEKASELLRLNPSDQLAKEVSQIHVNSPAPQPQPVINTQQEANPQPVSEQKPVQKPEPEPTLQSETKPETESVQNITLSKKYHTRFGIHSGVAFLDLSNLGDTWTPDFGVALYNIGGSRFGFGIDAYAPPAIKLNLGLDLALNVRLTDKLFSKASIGTFRCDSGSERGVTRGISGGLGLTYLVGKHFCLDAGIRFFPEVNMYESTLLSTTIGLSYQFPVKETVLMGGIAPSFTIGWVF